MRRAVGRAVSCLPVFLPVLAGTLAGQEPVAHYSVQATTAKGTRIPLQLALRLEHAPGPELRLGIPAWAPGSYRLQPFAEKIHDVAARDAGGKTLAVERVDANHWSVATGGASEVTVTWRVDLDGNARFMQR